MARVGGRDRSRQKPTAAPRTWSAPEQLWLALGLGGLVVALAAPEGVPWLVQPAAVVVSGLGLYGLGRAHGQARPDPIARGRVTYLERSLSQLALMVGYDGFAERSERKTEPAAPAAAPDDAPADGERERVHSPSGGRPGIGATDLDAPLPGETG